MSFEETEQSTTGAGFSFDAPVPLPQLGHRFCYPMRIGPLDALIFFEMKVCDTQRVGLTKISGSGLTYHDRDRFGVFAYSAVQVRFQTSVEDLVHKGLLQAFVIEEGKSEVALKPALFAHFICSNIFNYFVDLQTVAFETHWVPHITPQDLHSLNVVDWSDPKKPNTLGMLSGIPGKHHFTVGRQPGFPPKDPDRVHEVLAKFPLLLWEEVFNTALRDVEVGRFRSAIMHACLGVEAYLRAVLVQNASLVPDKNFLNRTLKPLATKKGCLPSLLGYSLDSAAAPATIRERYQRISALRDSVMHTGDLAYRWPLGSTTSVDMNSPEAVADHIDMALSLVSAIAEQLNGKGLSGVQRGMVASAVSRDDAPDVFG